MARPMVSPDSYKISTTAVVRRRKGRHIWLLRWLNPASDSWEEVSLSTKDQLEAIERALKFIATPASIRTPPGSSVAAPAQAPVEAPVEAPAEALVKVSVEAAPIPTPAPAAAAQVSMAVLVGQYKQLCDYSTSNRKATKPLFELIVRAWGRYTPKDVTTQMVYALLAGCEGRHKRGQAPTGLAPASWNRYLAVISKIFSMAEDLGYIEEDASPARKVKRRRLKQVPVRALTDAELGAVIGALTRPDYQQLVRFAADTGLRKGEILALLWRDVDLIRCEIGVHGTKSGKSRYIGMSRKVADLLLAKHAAQQPEPEDGVWVGIGDLKKALYRAGEAAGVRGLHFHMFRHTFATRLLDAGISLDRIQALLGHATLDMVRRYAKTRPEHLRSAIAALD